jgi:NTE family protein
VIVAGTRADNGVVSAGDPPESLEARRRAHEQRREAHGRGGPARGKGRVALVLSGGGARGAYEAGALSVLVPALERRGELPTVFVGSSVGAINAAGLASFWQLGAEEALATGLEIWRRVDKDAVIKPIISWQVPITALRYAGGILSVPGVSVPSLLDPEPLRTNLARWIDWRALARNVREGRVAAVAAVATATASGRPVVFVDGDPNAVEGAAAWHSHVISYTRTHLTLDHVRASAAIPIFFPPVYVGRPAGAAGWYIDGGTRLNTPLKPALDLGAERIVVVGMDAVAEPPVHAAGDEAVPDFGDGALHVLQGRLVDPMIEDVRMLGNANLFFASDHSGANAYRAARGKPPYRVVPYIFIAPERRGSIGKLAAEVFKERYGHAGPRRGLRRLGRPASLPQIDARRHLDAIRRLDALSRREAIEGVRALGGMGAGAVRGLAGLRGRLTPRGTDFRMMSRLLGAESPTHGELLSYLFFDREFIEELIAMGQRDAQRWLAASPGPGEPWQIDPLEQFTRRAA